MASLVKVAILSSVYGDYDSLHPAVSQSIEADWILVTDKLVNLPPWRTVTEKRPRVHPRLASRVPKAKPWLYTDADVTIWIDGNIEVTSPYFAEWCVNSLGKFIACQYKQDRKDVHAEVDASFQQEGKWEDEPIREMVEYYLERGYPPDYGIWWCGLMVRHRSFPDIGDHWLSEMVRWTCQDQISYSYLLNLHGIKPVSLDFKYDYRVRSEQISDIAVRMHPAGNVAEHFTLHHHPVNK